MTTQPEALRLADAMLAEPYKPSWDELEKAAAELRRLHALNAELVEALKETTAAHELGVFMSGRGLNKARAVIAKAEAT